MRSIVFIILLTLSLSGFTQNQEFIGGLKKKLRTVPSAERFELLNSIGWEYRFSHPDSTIYYAKSAYDLGRSLNLKSSLAKPLNYIGVAYGYKGDKLKSYEFYQEANQVAEGQHDSIQLAYTNNNIGRLLFDQGLLPKSFTYFLTALKIFKTIHDSTGLAYANQSLANLYRIQHNFSKAQGCLSD
jgi:tetratricopeptide (TPR) repeat protein